MTATTPATEEAAELDQPERVLDPADRLVNALAPATVIDAGLIEELEDGTAEESLEGWEIEDLDSASWASRSLARRRARIVALTVLANDQHARIDAWLKTETARLVADCAYFEGRLHGFHERTLALDPRAKTVKLPDGTELRSLAGKIAVEVTDLEQFSTWAEEHELALELLEMADPKPKKVTIAQRYAGKAEHESMPGTYPAVDPATSEVVPGIEIVRRPRTFTVSIPEA